MPPSPAPPPRIFLLSPAHSGGKRAQLLLRDEARFPLAERLRAGGAPIGEVFSFLSGLYFRGKLTYAERFGRPPAELSGAYVITTCCGLLSSAHHVGPADLLGFGGVNVDPRDERYRVPLLRDITRIAADPAVELVLLGSVATGKYLDVLLDVVGERLLVPTELVGVGDMRRGALLLRAARAGVELTYEPAAGAARRAARLRRRRTDA
jgi:hypothetical protein